MDVRIKIQRKEKLPYISKNGLKPDEESNTTKIDFFIKNNTSKLKTKVVLYHEENIKEITNDAQKIHFLFINIRPTTVKTHKKV